ncbi:anti-sigma factor domain-containing protein [Hutsoniella sourekii]
MDYRQALVAKVEADYAIVIDQEGRFQKIAIKPGLAIGQEIYYLKEDVLATSKAQAPTKDKIIRPTFRRQFLLAVACLLLIIGGTLFYQNHSYHQVVAAMSIGLEDSLEIQLNAKGQIVEMGAGQEEFKAFLGKPLEEVYPNLQSYIDQQNDHDIFIAYTDDLQEEELVDNLSHGSQEKNLILAPASLEDYHKSQQSKQSFTQYLADQKDIPLWSPEEGQSLTAQEKQKRLGDKAHFYQMGIDQEAHRREQAANRRQILNQNFQDRLLLALQSNRILLAPEESSDQPSSNRPESQVTDQPTAPSPNQPTIPTSPPQDTNDDWQDDIGETDWDDDDDWQDWDDDDWDDDWDDD